MLLCVVESVCIYSARMVFRSPEYCSCSCVGSLFISAVEIHAVMSLMLFQHQVEVYGLLSGLLSIETYVLHKP